MWRCVALTACLAACPATDIDHLRDARPLADARVGETGADRAAVDLATTRDSASGRWVLAGPAGSGPLGGVFAASNVVWVAGAGELWRQRSGEGWTRTALAGAPPLGVLHGLDAQQIWVTADVAIYRFDGTSWALAPGSAAIKSRYRAVWAESATRVFAVGDYGVVARYDGSSWSQVTGFVHPDLTGVWGAAGTLFVVGRSGTLLRLPSGSTAFKSDSSPVTTDLRAVWASSATEAWAVGDNGVILRFDGQTWRSEPSPTTLRLRAVRGAGQDLWAVGEQGTILRRAGGAWSKEASAASVDLGALHVDGDGAWAAGEAGVVLRFRN